MIDFTLHADSRVVLYHGDCMDVLRERKDNSVDAIITDPPYGLGFMGKKWDELPPGLPWAQECLRVLKPGGHIAAFGGTRTWHRLACAIEDAGFEMRDSLAWMYGDKMPKGRNVGKSTGDAAWEGWNTALKPSFEPIVFARKPFAVCVDANVLQHGTGAINVEACRVGTDAKRWPTNVLLDEYAAAALDEQTGTLTSGVLAAHHARRPKRTTGIYGDMGAAEGQRGYGDSGGASRFFPVFRYQARATTKERPKVNGVAHSTVKPLELMRWLVRLVTPPGGIVLDPFAGSGTTAEACVLEGFRCITVEREAEYLPLIAARMERVPPPTS